MNLETQTILAAADEAHKAGKFIKAADLYDTALDTATLRGAAYSLVLSKIRGCRAIALDATKEHA